MKRKHFFRKVLSIVTVLCFFCSLYFTARLVYSHIVIGKLCERIVQSKSTDKDKILGCLEYVAKIKTTGIIHYPNNRKNDSFTKKFWIFFYSRFPYNVIPPDIVLKHNISYTGPCGAKSKLLIAMLTSLDYDCWGLNQKGHTLVEVNINGIQTPIDPSFYLYFINEDSTFVETEEVVENYDLFLSNIERIKKMGKLISDYPVNDPLFSYNSIWRNKFFFYNQPYYLFIFSSLIVAAMSFSFLKIIKKE